MVADRRLKPILKWAGGKSQMLKDIVPRIPHYTGKYIEPFFGGGALFFDLQPDNAVISDSNPEIVNVYQQISSNVDKVIQKLKEYVNTEEMFYSVRAQQREELDPVEAAARTIYLNKTCFNGLYRVNRNGNFNTPYGRYKNPQICDEMHLIQASECLNKAKILCGDYKDVLSRYARKGDFIFLDPPYVPISEYSDFKRYTKEQFYEKDQRELAMLVDELYRAGCYIILTNSNHPLVWELYSSYPIDVIQTKRAISSKGEKRTGEDVIVSAFPH